MSIADDLFEITKNGIVEILNEGCYEKVKKFTFNGVEYKFDHQDIIETLPYVNAINLGILDDIEIKDIDGKSVVLTAKEYSERNKAGFINKATNELNLKTLLEILKGIQTFTALANFGSFDMAREYYLKKK